MWWIAVVIMFVLSVYADQRWGSAHWMRTRQTKLVTPDFDTIRDAVADELVLQRAVGDVTDQDIDRIAKNVLQTWEEEAERSR